MMHIPHIRPLVNRAAILLLLLLAAPCWATDWYVSPTGTASAPGTKDAPWDIDVASSGGPTRTEVKPGDTVWLGGGTYRGKQWIVLRGTPTAPITVRSVPGEWAVFDGFLTSTLTTTIDASTRTLSVADGDLLRDGPVVLIDKEQIRLVGRQGNIYTECARGYGGTFPSSHTAGAQIVVGGVNLTIGGSDTIYRDFEVTNSDPVRIFNPHNRSNPDRWRGEGIVQNGPRTKLVNLVVHDTRDGIFSSANSIGSEIYGCLLFNGGQTSNSTPAGHAMYIQGKDPVARKLIENCIALNFWNTGIKAESQNANTVGVDVLRCVSWNHGAPFGLTTRNPAVLIGANNGVADDDSVVDSVFYSPAGGSLAQIGYVGANGKLVFTGNRLWGKVSALQVSRWAPLTVQDNVVSNAISGGVLVSAGAASPGDVWDRNRYEVGANWMFGSTRLQTFAAWQSATGRDAAGSWGASGTALDVQVWPNRYEPGRATVVIYNRGGTATSTPLDLSRCGLAAGQRYEVRNAQNWPAAVTSGIYDPANPFVSLPLTNTTVRQPIGSTIVVASTAPEFNVFVIWPLSPAPTADPVIAAAEAALQSWLGFYGPRETDTPGFRERLGSVLDAIRGLR